MDSAPPLLDEAEGVEDAPDHPVAELGDAVREVVDREAEGEEARVLDLEAIVEDGDTERSGSVTGLVGGGAA